MVSGSSSDSDPSFGRCGPGFGPGSPGFDLRSQKACIGIGRCGLFPYDFQYREMAPVTKPTLFEF
jgi:hypothetical protein